MDTFDGLPTHPMFVHIPIVLGPLLAAATVWMAIRPGMRIQLRIALTVGNLLLVGFLFLLVRPSGLFLEEELSIERAIADHQALGEQTIMLSALMFVASLAMVAFGRLRHRRSGVEDGTTALSTTSGALLWSDIAVRTIGAAVAVLVVVWMVRTGHSGGDVVWQGVVE